MTTVSDLVPVLFIGGIGRSGTTVFELSLGADERTVPLGEVTHLWQRSLIDNEPCGCGVLFSQCEFWQRVGQEAFGGWHTVDPERVIALKRRIDRTVRTPQLALHAGSQAWLADVREYASYYARIYRAAARTTGRALVVDSSKQASLPYVLQYAEGLDLRVLHCVRDSRAVAYSWTKNVVRPESRTAGSHFMTRYSPGVLALKWVQHNLVIDALRFQGVSISRLRYEDWVAEPAAALRATLSFAGLAPNVDDQTDRRWVDLHITHTCSGNPMRFTQGKVEIRRDESWQQSLPRLSQFLVTAITAPVLIAYGYARSEK